MLSSWRASLLLCAAASAGCAGAEQDSRGTESASSKSAGSSDAPTATSAVPAPGSYAAEERVVRAELTGLSEGGPVRPAVWPTSLSPLATLETRTRSPIFSVRTRIVVERARLLCFLERELLLSAVIPFGWRVERFDGKLDGIAALVDQSPGQVFVHGFAAPGEAPDEAGATVLSERRARGLIDQLVAAGKSPSKLVLRAHGTELSAVLDVGDAPKRARVELGGETPSSSAELREVPIDPSLSGRWVDRARRVRSRVVSRFPTDTTCVRTYDSSTEICRELQLVDDDPASAAWLAEMHRYAIGGCRPARLQPGPASNSH